MERFQVGEADGIRVDFRDVRRSQGSSNAVVVIRDHEDVTSTVLAGFLHPLHCNLTFPQSFVARLPSQDDIKDDMTDNKRRYTNSFMVAIMVLSITN